MKGRTCLMTLKSNWMVFFEVILSKRVFLRMTPMKIHIVRFFYQSNSSFYGVFDITQRWVQLIGFPRNRNDSSSSDSSAQTENRFVLRENRPMVCNFLIFYLSFDFRSFHQKWAYLNRMVRIRFLVIFVTSIFNMTHSPFEMGKRGNENLGQVFYHVRVWWP